ncbi:MAG TPA: hypothetical protein VEQ10_21320 [Vicinamibacteria bacterium]|nr:hypothetical protein [Vicinamibacteria bacterium]
MPTERPGTRAAARRRTVGNAAEAELETDYAPEPKLAMWVPVEMRERYQDLPGGGFPVFGSPTEAVARYSSFRRFSVATQETARVPQR